MALFPIHDLVREDDIRMRRRRALLLLAATVVVPWMVLGHHAGVALHRQGVLLDRHVSVSWRGMAGPAADDPIRSFMVPALLVDLPCADTVTLLPRPGLGDRVLVSAQRGQDAALARIGLDDGTLGQPGTCTGTDARFVVQRDPALPLQIVQSRLVEIRGGRFTGPVTIQSDGSGSVSLDAVGALTVRQRDAGDVQVGGVDGPVVAALQGSGSLTVRTGAASGLDVSVGGAGDVRMGRTAITDAHLTLSDGGGFVADTISGTLDVTASGGGDLTVGRVFVGDARLQNSGGGDIVLRGGQIGRIDAELDGGGDLKVDAAIATGRVNHHGGGDVALSHAAAGVERIGNEDGE